MSFAGRRQEDATDVEPLRTTILGEPAGGGWRVTSRWEEDLRFLSGGLAEVQARCLASIGQNTVVEIRDRNDVVVGAVLCASGAVE
jgi:hypothetical protein